MYFLYFTPLHIIGALLLIFFVGFLLFKDYFIERQRNYLALFSRIFLFSACIFVILGLLGPKKATTDRELGEERSSVQNIAFVVDVSESMNTLDITPNSLSRLEVAKLFIGSFIDTYQHASYSLSIFAGAGNRKLPFTEDRELFQRFLKNISSEDSIKTGTDIETAFETGIMNFSYSSGGILYILTDGGENENISDMYKRRLQEKNISLVIVGIGSEKGGYIPIGRDVFGNIRYKTYGGEKVLTKRESKILSSIASQFDGKYFEISSESDIDNLITTLGKQAFSGKLMNGDNLESSLIPYFIFVSFLFFFISLCIDIRFLGKRY